MTYNVFGGTLSLTQSIIVLPGSEDPWVINIKIIIMCILLCTKGI